MIAGFKPLTSKVGRGKVLEYGAIEKSARYTRSQNDKTARRRFEHTPL